MLFTVIVIIFITIIFIFVLDSATVVFFAAAVTMLMTVVVVVIFDACIDALDVDIVKVIWQVLGLDQHIGVLTFKVILLSIKGSVLRVTPYSALIEACGETSAEQLIQ